MTDLISNTRRPDVSFYSNGRVDITARVAKELRIETGDVINISTDGYEYLLYVKMKADNVRGAHEAVCYPTSRRNTHNFRAHSIRLARAVIDIVGVHLGEARLPVGKSYFSKELGSIVVPLITRNPLTK